MNLSSPLVKYPHLTLTLPPQYFGSVEYYAAIAAFGRVVIDGTIPFDKRQKSVHRCEIADTHGRLQLTVPICKPDKGSDGGKPTWADIRISDHGHWWQSVSESIASAYGRSPFYEFLIDRLSPFFDETTCTSFESVASLDEALNRVVCRFLGIHQGIIYTPSPSYTKNDVITADRLCFTPTEYYQVRQARLGFIGGLSILDLIFNLGNESPLLLRELSPRII